MTKGITSGTEKESVNKRCLQDKKDFAGIFFLWDSKLRKQGDCATLYVELKSSKI